MIAAPALRAGLPDPVMDPQRIFRAAMSALSRPGSIQIVAPGIVPPPPLYPATAALTLALADFESPVWLDPLLATEPTVAEFLRFHTGATLATEPSAAAFALISDAAALPAFTDFASGTLEYPDRSTTLIVQVSELTASPGWLLSGPGIDGNARLHAAPLPADFATRLDDNRTRFPCGIDIIFAAHDRIAALPRTTVVTDEQGA